MPDKVLHVSHTDVTIDSRILKELNVSESIFNSTFGIGVSNKKDYKQSHKSHKIINLSLLSKRLVFLPRMFRIMLEVIELNCKIFFEALRIKPSLIHCHDVPALPVSTLIKIISGCKLIYDAHELESERNGLSWLGRKLTFICEKLCWRFVDGLIVVSPSIKEWYLMKLGKKNSEIILNSPLIGEVNKRNPDYLRCTFNIPDASKIFIYVGLFTAGRGIQFLLEAFSDHRVKSHIVFLGYGDLEDELKRLSSINSRIHVHPGVVHSEVTSIVSSADVGVALIENISLSDYYSLPNKFFEYVFSGLPVLVSDFPDISRVVKKYDLGVTTQLCRTAIIEAITGYEAQVSKKLINGEHLQQLGWDNQKKKLIAFYQAVLDEKESF